MFSLAMAMVDAHSLSNIICRSGEWQVTVGRKSVCVWGGGERERERESERERDRERQFNREREREYGGVTSHMCVDLQASYPSLRFQSLHSAVQPSYLIPSVLYNSGSACESILVVASLVYGVFSDTRSNVRQHYLYPLMKGGKRDRP